MLKRLFNLFKAFFVCSILLFFVLCGISYYEYNQTLKYTPIADVILDVRSSDHYTPIHEISPTFLDAITAVEDHRFYQHGGIDPVGLMRALITNILSGKIEQGGSTITQQLAKNLFLNDEQTIERKIKEVFIANILEKNYTKDELLELYANIIYYGDGNTGIYEASYNYFNIAPIDLTYDQATLLAGLPQSPSYYSLSNNYDAARKRQEQVILALNSFNS